MNQVNCFSRNDLSYWPAPAKLNLMLRIVGRREDGYHLLQTVFQFLNYGDCLGFVINDHGQISQKGANVIPTDKDLTIKAASLLQQSAGITKGVNILLDKRIPIGAGLGGGSSDAATTLWVLNQLWNVGLSTPQLMALALQLGADVPIFIYGQSAWAEGVGEKLTPIALEPLWFLVLVPPVFVSTKKIFSHSDLTRDSSLIKIADFLEGETTNDCQSLVCQLYPQVKQVIDWLSQYTTARLTGTGGAVFGAFKEKLDAEKVFNQRPKQWQGFIAQGYNQSPLHYWGVAKRQGTGF